MVGKEKNTEFRIIPKKEHIMSFDSKSIMIRQIEYFDLPYKTFIEEKITEEVIEKDSFGLPRKKLSILDMPFFIYREIIFYATLNSSTSINSQ